MLDKNTLYRGLEAIVKIEEASSDYRKKTTGRIGESAINAKYSEQLDKSIYHVINDVVIKAGNGTTQIDQIIVSKFGIFVVEIKNMEGLIYGIPAWENWKCMKLLGGRDFQFKNPIRQNDIHVKMLKYLLNLQEDDKFISMIVFISQGFLNNMPPNVIKSQQYLNFIRSRTVELLSEEKVNQIVQTIQTNRLSSEDHEKYINSFNQTPKADKDNPPQCPRCGKTMVLRTSKKGKYQGNQFWGCSGYPNCKTILQTEQQHTTEKIRKMKSAFNRFMG